MKEYHSLSHTRWDCKYVVMTEDSMTDLSKLSGLFVISRSSAFTYKGRTVRPH